MNGIDPINWTDSVLGQTLSGRYRVLNVLGTGGMGGVFEAEHQGTARRVAIKLLLPSLREHPKAIKRFQIEAQAAASTNRRGVVDVLDYDIDQALGHYLVMEMLQGESFEQRLSRRQRLDPDEALDVAAEILHTLDAVHAHDIVHRDLKPANIFVADEENREVIKLLDFGISRVVTARFQTQLTTPGMAVGTPRYMSPEQARCEPNVDGRADLYSIGAVLYEALSGIKPYADAFPGRVMAEALLRAPKPLNEVAPGLHPALLEFVQRAMARDRDERFGSATEMLDALDHTRRRLEGWMDPTSQTISSPTLDATVPSSSGPSTLRRGNDLSRSSWGSPDGDVPSWPPSGRLMPSPSKPGNEAATVSARPARPPSDGSDDKATVSARPSPRPPSAPPHRSPSAPPRRSTGGRSNRSRPRLRWWMVPTALVVPMGVAGMILGAVVLAQRLLDDGDDDGRATQAVLPNSGVATAPLSGGVTPGQPGSSPPPASSRLEQSLRSALGFAQSAHNAGRREEAEARLNTMFQLATNGNVQPNTPEAVAVGEGHLLAADIDISRIATPPPPTSLIELRDGLSPPFTRANDHVVEAVQTAGVLASCGHYRHGLAAERHGRVYLEVHQSEQHRSAIAPALLPSLMQMATNFLETARSAYEMARRAPAFRDCHDRAAEGLQRIATLSTTGSF